MRKSFQKLASFLLIITMMGTPLVSAFGQSFSCPMQADSSSMMETVKNSMPADHDCCEKPEKVLCTHCDECDCDQAQANLNAIKFETVNLIFTAPAQFKNVSHSTRSSTLLSALYRPPRKISKKLT